MVFSKIKFFLLLHGCNQIRTVLITSLNPNTLRAIVLKGLISALQPYLKSFQLFHLSHVEILLEYGSLCCGSQENAGSYL